MEIRKLQSESKPGGEAKETDPQPGKQRAIKVKHHDPISVPRSPEEQARLTARRRRSLTLRFLMIFLAVAVTVGIFLYVMRKSDIEQSRQFARRAAYQQSIAAGCASVQGVAKAVKAMDGEAQRLLEAANGIVAAVVGHGLSQTGRQVKASAETSEPDTDDEEGEAQPQKKLPPLLLKSRTADVEAAAMKVVEHVAAFSSQLADIVQSASDAAAMKKKMETITGEALLAEADGKVRNYLTAAQQWQSGATQELAAAAASLRALMAARDRFEQEKREEERKAEERRKAAEYQKRKESEIAMAAQSAESAKAFLKDMQFTQAVEQLTGKLAEFQTEEGRQAMKNVVDRYACLAHLKAFLIEQINSRPFAWGWGRANAVRDVLGADENVIKLRQGQATWADVNPQQMTRFVEKYASTEDLPFRLRGKLRLGAAIYFHEIGLPEAAAAYADKAVAADRDLNEEVARLLKPQPARPSEAPAAEKSF